MTASNEKCPLMLLKKQRSHALFVLSNPVAGRESTFLEWYQGVYRRAVLDTAGVLGGQHYEKHQVDLTRGRFEPLPFRYLGLYDLSLDGAQEADGVIERITSLHREQAAAQVPVVWVYYPMSEKIGRSPETIPSMLVVAFANGVAGQEAEFREWYATRHIRHALNAATLVSGQCYARTLFQQPGYLGAIFSVIAIYEQEGTPETLLDSLASLPQGVFRFPALDLGRARFAECAYQPLIAST